jgi:peptidoglycan hydrolase CwlO-like protein
MKATITILVMTISLILCSCNEASKKDLSDAKDNINKANRELQQAAKDSRDAAKEKTISEWKSFNEKSEKNVETLNHQIREFQKKITTADQKENLRLKNELKQNHEKLKTMREKLRERNSEFENGMLKFDDSVESKNESFQREFNYDMDELDKAVNDLFKNNVK